MTLFWVGHFPFFKQFVAGGPNSMRAWGIRQLGLGSSLLSDTSSVFRDRFGDIQLEGNVEFRYPFFTIGSIKVNSAIFTDIGNIWNLKNDESNPNSKLAINNLYRDLAIAAGTGLRFDFDYFLIRIDFAYKIKDPARLTNSGWMSLKNFEWQNNEFGVSRNNYAIQLGIGMPF
jgi:outer membrane protein assembly factor BamA